MKFFIGYLTGGVLVSLFFIDYLSKRGVFDV